MIDGAKLSFMENTDIYALFGNLMDNAIEAVEKLVDNEKRIITMNVYVENNILYIDMSNYYQGKVTFDNNGFPLTTKETNGYHGFGLRSVIMLCKSYGGRYSLSTDDGIFSLQLEIPLK